MSESVTRRTEDVVGSPAPVSAPPSLDSDRVTQNPVSSSSDRSDVVLVGDSSSVRSRASIGLDDQKTVISKRPPMAEPATPRAQTPSEMGRTLVGERLGHFQLEEFVGGGGMGAVFRATDMMLSRTVAVKVLSREQTDDETLLRFQKEAQNAAKLDHERIARVYYVNEDKGWHYIVFEYIDGVNVRDLVEQQGPLSIDEAIYYVLQVTEALRHAARRDVVHRDIKPSNILVMADGRVKLVDMGLARSHQLDSSQADLTQSGVTLGTFDYISPEQAREPRNADVRSDIYSLGCTLYFVLTGRPPFPEGTVLQKLLSHSSDPPPDPRLFRPDIPDDVCRILMKMLAKLPTQRYQTPDELIADLLRIADRLGLERTSSGGAIWVARPDTSTPWYEKHLPWAAPVITLVLVILALDSFGNSATERIVPVRPNLLSAAPTDRKPTGPTIPIAPKQNPKTQPKPDGVNRSTDEEPTDEDTESPKETTTPGTKTLPETALEEPSTEKPAEAIAAPVAPRLLLVGAPGTPHTADAKVVSSLAAAYELAAKSPTVEAIELHFDGERLESPFAIAVPQLTVRAAPGRMPVLVFRPTVDLPVDEHRMLRLGPGDVTFQGVQFRLELPTERTTAGWSLFQLTDSSSLLLDRCALTIRNATASGLPSQSDVSFVEVVPPVVSDTQATEDATRGRPLVRLFSTLARGEASLVRSEAGHPFRLEWTQGLLATTERLVEISGAARLSTTWPRAEIDLENVTAAARSGLCLLTSEPDAPKHLGLKVAATDCIFLTDPTAPLIEHRTLDLFDELKRKPPTFEGQGNIFAGPRQYWRMVSQRTTAPMETMLNVSLERGADYGFGQAVWSESVMWKALPSPTRPVHLHVKADYALSDDPNNPALRRGESAAGFDATVMPEFVVEPAPPAGVIKPPLPIAPREEASAPMASPMPTPPVSEKMKMMMTPSSVKPSPPKTEPPADPPETLSPDSPEPADES
jgi:serine/threonine protein kinase